jgi:hypothetical protein
MCKFYVRTPFPSNTGPGRGIKVTAQGHNVKIYSIALALNYEDEVGMPRTFISSNSVI